MRWRPASRVGRQAVTFAGLCVAGVVLLVLAFALGIVKPAGSYTDSWGQLVWGLGIWACGIAAVVTGLVAIFRHQERSWMVVLATALSIGTARTRRAPTAAQLRLARYDCSTSPPGSPTAASASTATASDVALGNRDRGGVREHRRDPPPPLTPPSQPNRAVPWRTDTGTASLLARPHDRTHRPTPGTRHLDCPQAPPVNGRPRRMRLPWPWLCGADFGAWM